MDAASHQRGRPQAVGNLKIVLRGRVPSHPFDRKKSKGWGTEHLKLAERGLLTSCPDPRLSGRFIRRTV